MNNKILAIGIIFFSFVSGIFGSYIFSQFNSPQPAQLKQNGEIIKNGKNISITDLQNEITQIVENVSPSVVNIVINKDLTIYRNDPFNFFRQPVWSVNQKVGWWTGFFITSDGIILTNKHVISDTDAQYTVILKNWEEYSAKVLAVDPLSDLAVIKINSQNTFQPVEFIQQYEWENSEIKIWQFAIAIWNALAEFQNSVALWVISGSNRSIEAQWEKLSGLLQTDAAINPGNSGGPLVNLNGEVMWINTAISGNAQWIWFSIPLSTKKIDYILESVEKYWEIKKPFIGINYVLLNQAWAKQLWVEYDYWAYILDEENAIVEWSSAQKSWIKPGDIILKVNNTKITQNNDLASFIQNRIPGETLELEMYRNWEIINTSLKLWLQN